MDFGHLKQLFTVHKEKVALFGVALIFILLVVGGLYLQKKRTKEEINPELVPEKVTFTPQKSTTTGEYSEKNETGAGESKRIATYFLKPTPDDLLNQLSKLDNLKPEVIEGKYVQMPVLWQVYFFAFEKGDRLGRLICDVSEDGFGVSVETTIIFSQFPEVESFTQGDIVWLGGKITAVDPAGTGTVYLETEYLSSKKPSPQASQ